MNNTPKKVTFQATEAVSKPFPTYASTFLKDVLPTWTDKSLQRRRDLAGALSAVSRALDIPLQNLALDCATLNIALKTGSIAERLLTQNTRSALRFILRRLGLHLPYDAQHSDLTAEWGVLLERIAKTYRRHAIINFARYCSSLRISPGQVTSGTLAAFEVSRATEMLCRDAADLARRTLSTWKWACSTVEGWPQQGLERGAMREPYTFRIDTYPLSFQADVKLFVDRLSGKDVDQIFADGCDEWQMAATSDAGKHGARSRGGRKGPARAETVRTRLFQIQQAAAALVHAGHAQDTIIDLRSLVDPIDHAKAIATFFEKRAGTRRNVQTAGILEVLRQIARHHCDLPANHVSMITTALRRAEPEESQGMTPKNRMRLRALVEDTNRAVLLHLPSHLMRLASEASRRPAEAARLAMSAVALEILLACPLRMKNLQSLTIRYSLQRLGPGGKHITHLYVAAQDVKNGQSIEWPLPVDSAALLERFIKDFRPTLAAPGNEFLFPGTGAKPRSINAMAVSVTEPIARWVGVEINPHLLRHFAAWMYLKSNPGGYEAVRRILGHKSVEMTIRFYTGFEAEFCFKKFHNTVLTDRKASKAVAVSALRRKAKGKTHRKGGK